MNLIIIHSGYSTLVFILFSNGYLEMEIGSSDKPKRRQSYAVLWESQKYLIPKKLNKDEVDITPKKISFIIRPLLL